MHQLILYIFVLSVNFAWALPQDLAATTPLADLEIQVQKELQMLNIPIRPWVLHSAPPIAAEVLDVAIIGGGMGGLATGFALLKEGVHNIKIFDENSDGKEGPWSRYARMNMLRSGKTCLGPVIGVPSLTFWAWFETQYGEDSWKQLKAVPTQLWNNYLQWFKHVLHLPVENGLSLKSILPENGLLKLVLIKDGIENIRYASKVVLATGRDGCGGFELPAYIKGISSHLYAHTCQPLEVDSLTNKNIVIIGAGASAFDAAGVALEEGAQSVCMIIRRETLPQVNKFNQFYYPGIARSFYYLEDDLRWEYFTEAFENGIPPPKSALERIKNYSNFSINYNTHIVKISDEGDHAMIFTNQGTIKADFLIIATGFDVDLAQRPELSTFYEKILTWDKRIPQKISNANHKLGRFPYLGPHFEFLETEPGRAEYLKNIYCFNYGAFISHGLLSGDIALCSLGAERLAQGITIDLFLSDSDLYLEQFKGYKTPLFNPCDYENISDCKDKKKY